MPRHPFRLALAVSLLSALIAVAPAFAAPEPVGRTVVLQDPTGRGFPPDLVNYTIAAPTDGGAGLRVLDADGKPVPVQVTPGEQGKATLSFVAAVPPRGTAPFTVRTDGQPAAAASAVSAAPEGDALVLANQHLAVRVPAPREQTYAQPVPAATLPAPILAFRGADGAWKGAGAMLAKQLVKKFTVVQVAGGPVFVETRYRLDYAAGGWYEATVRVTDRAPFAQVTEAYDLGASENAEYWQLDLSQGWNADAAEHMNVAGQGFAPVQYPTLAAEEQTVASGPNVGSDQSGGGARRPVRAIHHDSCWGAKFVSFYGIHDAAERKAKPDGYALAMVAPLHKGDWRRANAMPVYVEGGRVRVCFPLDVAAISWRNEPGSDSSAFSTHEHDPALPATYGRRVWGLVLAHPTLVVAPDKGLGSTCLGYSVRNLYGTVGLDRYKDFVTEWPAGDVTYPRVFITPGELEKYLAAVKADPDFPLATYDNAKNPIGLKNYFLFTRDPAVAQAEIPDVIRGLDAAIRYHAVALSVPHHHAMGMWSIPLAHAESVLSWPDLPGEVRAAIRGRLALLCYLLTDPDVTSAGDGSHHGNPNMGVARLSDRSNLAALIPDHPMHRAWAEYMGDFLAYKQGTFMAPEGAWIEYGVSYHMHGYGKISRGLMGALADEVSAADRIRAYNRQDFDYYLNLLTPVDPRFGIRLIPGMANAPTGCPVQFLGAMGNFADRDPEFAANLRWGWEQAGRMIGGAYDLGVSAMARPQIPAREPRLTSRVYPGFGVVFRAHQGPDETYLALRSGYHWSHWNQDQGNLVCYAKGAALLPPQPYQYARNGEIDPAFPDKNLVRFGDPRNDMPHAWADSNILDAALGERVDYAWHSTGYPDWFFSPGATAGMGEPRPRADAAGTADGEFTWDRQVAFLKSRDPKGANYFVIRDGVNGPGKAASWWNLNIPGRKRHLRGDGEKLAVDTEWPTKLDLLFPGRPNPAFEMLENRLPTDYAENVHFRFGRPLADGSVISRDFVLDDAAGTPVRWEKWTGQRKQNPAFWDHFISIAHNPANPAYDYHYAFSKQLGNKQQQVTLRLAGQPGEDVTWVLFPRGPGEAEPTATLLAPGAMKIVTGEGTDYVFLSATPLEYSGEEIEFAGQAGVVRVPKTGPPELVLLRGRTLTFQGKTVGGPAAAAPRVTAEGDTIRFVAPAAEYVKLTHGNVGVRGVGPFDLTFTPAGITGTVAGDIRTIVTTWPEKIARPGYWMDGVRWCAGFADEHSITRGTTTPQFGIAFGVSAGKHAVKIAEWEWPAVPPAPARASLSLE
jgi:hypothetical protein